MFKFCFLRYINTKISRVDKQTNISMVVFQYLNPNSGSCNKYYLTNFTYIKNLLVIIFNYRFLTDIY